MTFFIPKRPLRREAQEIKIGDLEVRAVVPPCVRQGARFKLPEVFIVVHGMGGGMPGSLQSGTARAGKVQTLPNPRWSCAHRGLYRAGVKAQPRPFFYPKFVRLLRGYRGADFLSDLSAGLTVGIIALPLAIGFGIASGVTPGQGLWTGIIASIVVALLGGSRFQVAGPTGA